MNKREGIFSGIALHVSVVRTQMGSSKGFSPSRKIGRGLRTLEIPPHNYKKLIRR